jgi:hypothetical protein
MLLHPGHKPPDSLSSGRGRGLHDATVEISEGPDVDVGRFDAQRGERRADLASMIRTVMKRLGESDADRGVSSRHASINRTVAQT